MAKQPATKPKDDDQKAVRPDNADAPQGAGTDQDTAGQSNGEAGERNANGQASQPNAGQTPANKAEKTTQRLFKITVWHNGKRFDPGKPYSLSAAEEKELKQFLVDKN